MNTLRRPFSLSLSVVIAGLLVHGCASHHDATRLVVVVDTDLHICQEVDTIVLREVGPTGGEVTFDLPTQGPDAVALPAYHTLVPASERLGPVTIEAVALREGQPVVTQQVLTEFVTGETKMVSLELSYRCKGVTWCASGETCRQGACVKATVAPEALPAWRGPPAALDHGALDPASCELPGRSCQPVQLAVGTDFGCVRCTAGNLYCWGSNDDEQLAVKRQVVDEYRPEPLEATSFDNVTQISAGHQHVCALLQDGTDWCWGRNANLQLGYTANNYRRHDPIEPELTHPSPVIHVSAGQEASCFLHQDQKISCFGRSGELGDNTADSNDSLTPFVMPDVSAVAVNAGTVSSHLCTIDPTGQLECWSWNNKGQVGIGSTNPNQVNDPTAIAGVDRALEVALGSWHTCTIQAGSTENELYCWGDPTYGALGDIPPAANTYLPSQVQGVEPRAVATGQSHTCIVDQKRNVQCWGRNNCAQAESVDLDDVVQVGAGDEFNCALLGSGKVFCWGNNAHGQLAMEPDPQTACSGTGEPFIATPVEIPIP